MYEGSVLAAAAQGWNRSEPVNSVCSRWTFTLGVVAHVMMKSVTPSRIHNQFQ